jgi:hypothetical protein
MVSQKHLSKNQENRELDPFSSLLIDLRQPG